jgi:hypothetical protein
MVDRHTALLHHFFEMPVTQGIGRVPANADQNYIDQKSHPLRVQHGHWPVFKTED